MILDDFTTTFDREHQEMIFHFGDRVQLAICQVTNEGLIRVDGLVTMYFPRVKMSELDGYQRYAWVIAECLKPTPPPRKESDEPQWWFDEEGERAIVSLKNGVKLMYRLDDDTAVITQGIQVVERFENQRFAGIERLVERAKEYTNINR